MLMALSPDPQLPLPHLSKPPGGLAMVCSLTGDMIYIKELWHTARQMKVLHLFHCLMVLSGILMGVDDGRSERASNKTRNQYTVSQDRQVVGQYNITTSQKISYPSHPTRPTIANSHTILFDNTVQSVICSNN